MSEVETVARKLYLETHPTAKHTESEVYDKVLETVQNYYKLWTKLSEDSRPPTFELYVRLMVTALPLSKDIALKCISWGFKVTHSSFDDEEFIMKGPNVSKYFDENNCHLSISWFWKVRQGEEWNTNWAIFKNKINSKKS